MGIPRIQVLLVEDDPDDAALLRRMLGQSASAEFDVTHVQRLAHALEKLAAERFDVALLDLSLPDSKGLTTFEQAQARAPSVPMVVLSGMDDEHLSVSAVQRGAQDYLVKGKVNADMLARSVRYALERQRLKESLARQNADLQRAHEQAEQESQFKSRFLSSLSHELRTPLNAVIGFSELLADEASGPLTARQRQYVQYVLTSARHQLQLINDILDLSKVEAGRMELHRTWMPLAPLAEAVQTIVQPLADKQGVRLHVAVDANLPELFVDAVRVKQVLYNLLSNGIKFTPSGGSVTLTAKACGSHVEIAVEDTGIGIRPEDLPKLFREFEQLEPRSGGKTEGTGLGLALTRRLVELHGGTTGVSSEVDVGSRFTVTLPITSHPG